MNIVRIFENKESLVFASGTTKCEETTVEEILGDVAALVKSQTIGRENNKTTTITMAPSTKNNSSCVLQGQWNRDF